MTKNYFVVIVCLRMYISNGGVIFVCFWNNVQHFGVQHQLGKCALLSFSLKIGHSLAVFCSLATSEGVERAMERQRRMQEEVAEDMLHIARSLKQNSLVAKDIITGDNQVLVVYTCSRNPFISETIKCKIKDNYSCMSSAIKI